MEDSKTKIFNYPKKLETVYESSISEWDELHIIGDDQYFPIIFLISDDGHVVVEFAEGEQNNGPHLALSELKDIIAEVERKASIVFNDGEASQRTEKE